MIFFCDNQWSLKPFWINTFSTGACNHIIDKNKKALQIHFDIFIMNFDITKEGKKHTKN